MKIRLVFLGKTRNPHLRTLIEDYRQRLARFAPVEILERRSAAAAELAADGLLVLLDPAGKEFTSDDLARWLNRQQATGRRQLTFLLGAAEGFSDEMRRSADLLLSLSRFTLPHELARLVLVEQLDRAFARLRGHPYPK
jgi:23S rRNA (pseudouridine1915-N3)-methyltransferase